MMVKFFNHGQGKAAPAVNYLIEEVVVDYDQNRQPKRDAAGKVKRTSRSIMPEVLKGHPERIIDLVDAVPHRWKYKSGVLSFAAEDASSEAEQRQLMDDFEAFACPGLQHDRCRMLWVRHLHAGRVELYFLMPRMDLLTGKSLNIAPPGHEKSYMAFMDLHNRRHGWADPMDPARARVVKTVTEAPERAQTRAEVNEWVKTQIEFGVIHDRKTLLEALKSIGFEIPRAGEIYVTVADPDFPKNRWRLKGAYFNVDWTADTTQPPHPTEHGSDARGSARLAAIPIGELERRVTEDCAKRRTYNLERFGKPEKPLSRHDPRVEGRGRTPQGGDRNLKSAAGRTAPKSQQDRNQKDDCAGLIRGGLGRNNDGRHRISRRENRDNTATRTIDATDPRAADRQPDYPWRRGLGANDHLAAGAGARKVPNRNRYEPNLFENGVIPDDPNTTRERVARLRRRIREERLRVHAAATRTREGVRRLAERIARLVVDLAGRLRGRAEAARPGKARNAEENRLHLQTYVNGTNEPER